MYKTRWSGFMSSGLLLFAVLLSIIGCMQQESVQDTTDKKTNTEKMKTDSISNDMDSTSVTN